ncbi:MAG: TraR/DksA C4-type zinc finger protein [Planctomycetes bacterium]|jgi:DnaK suppressor protein|nr:TraR/DksA C4-type zinc finger protein [Planctomycetota bacterium]
MARRDALLGLHKSLIDRRDELLRRMGGGLKDLLQRNRELGDSADQAFESCGEEVSSQLAELESRELMKIDRALAMLKQGTYGLCEGCQKKIPVARLNALPFSTTCIQCQREMESTGEWGSGPGSASWERVSDVEARMREPREVDLSQLEMDYSK